MRIKRLVIILTCAVFMLTGCTSAEFDINNTVAEVSVVKDNAIDVYTVSETRLAIDKKITKLVNSENLISWGNLQEVPDTDYDSIVRTIELAENSVRANANQNNVYLNDTLRKYVEWVFNFYSDFKFIKLRDTLIGYDASTQTFVVDTEYKTDNTARKDKIKVPDIIKGEPNEEVKLQVRYKKYMSQFSNQYSMYGSNPGYTPPIYDYETTPIDDIETQHTAPIQENEGISEDATSIPVVQPPSVYQMLGTKTTSRVTSQVGMKNSTLKLRWIVNRMDSTGVYKVTSVYLLNYDTGVQFENVDNSLVTDTLTNFVYRYNISENDMNYIGLYKLSDNFGRYQEQYTSLYDCTYTSRTSKIDGILARDGNVVKLAITSELTQRVINGETTNAVYLERSIWTVKWTNDDFKVIDIEVIFLDLKTEPEKVINKDYIQITEEFRSAMGENNEDVKPEIKQVLAGAFDVIKQGEVAKLVDPTKTISQRSYLGDKLSKYKDADQKHTFITDWLYTSDITASLKLREYYIMGNKTLEAFSDVKLNKVNMGDSASWYISSYETTYIAEVTNNAIEYYSGSLESTLQ